VNYRHAYHAGNFADVAKHVALVLALDLLARKDAPLFFLDTHSGRGDYPLSAAETQRAAEYRTGILPLLTAAQPPEAVARYLELVRAHGLENQKLVRYPGSPRLAARCLREGDRAALCELERGEASALRREFHGDARFAVHERDGYEALVALVPPREKRGLVLVDPPYEQPDEFERVEVALLAALRRWATGTYVVWYPLKHGPAAARFLTRMQASGVRRQLVAELLVRHEDSPVGLNGSGLLVVNPPWQFDERLRLALRWLHAQLAPAGQGGVRVDWRVGE
jgi:23S rRNA (adenine2030-N6)-methyltransferase